MFVESQLQPDGFVRFFQRSNNRLANFSTIDKNLPWRTPADHVHIEDAANFPKWNCRRFRICGRAKKSRFFAIESDKNDCASCTISSLRARTDRTRNCKCSRDSRCIVICTVENLVFASALGAQMVIVRTDDDESFATTGIGGDYVWSSFRIFIDWLPK